MRRKKLSYYSSHARAVLVMAFLIAAAGCEKVINVDLNEASPRIVIEGLIDNDQGPYTVLISKTGSYFGEPDLPRVTGALAIITDDTGIIDTLSERSPGVYMTTRTRGLPGRTYTLTVTSGNDSFSGQSTMPSNVAIDSLRLARTMLHHWSFGSTAGETTISLYCYFNDPPQKNFYRIRVFKNKSTEQNDYHLFDDQYTNGEETELRVAHAEAGDTIKVDLMSLDRSTYEYYRTLEDLLHSNPVFGSTPANPDSNLDNDALGYFGACTISSRTIIVTEAMVQSLK